MRVKKDDGLFKKSKYTTIRKPWIYTTSACAGWSGWGLRSTCKEQTKKKKKLGLLAPPSDIEVQEQCIQMEEIEMQHRIQ